MQVETNVLVGIVIISTGYQLEDKLNTDSAAHSYDPQDDF
jgi:hypothetical protein